ncbi:MAG: TIGR04076 family protein [Bacteroidetes bacterium]|nr:TIGR04076 family protein [Bacteroidota bacterium]
MEQATFELYDLRIDVVESGRPFVCSHQIGPAIEVKGENLYFLNNQPFSMYALAALIPLLPTKQRPLNPADWMATDHVIACPDPHCGAQFRISRTGKQIIRRETTTVVPQDGDHSWK